MNLHITPRPIYFSRHGQSEYNVEDRIGGDSALTSRGEEYVSNKTRFYLEINVSSVVHIMDVDNTHIHNVYNRRNVYL
jgi:hypothetical protein